MSYQSPVSVDQESRLRMLPECLNNLLEGETDLVVVLSNASALIFDLIDDINWAGFYHVKDGILLLAPFQGKPACVRIAYGRGVCGTAWAEDRTIVVSDVHKFPGHIACDSESRSEIVAVLHNRDGNAFGVLDIDSPKLDRFGDLEREIIEKVARILEDRIANCQ